MAKPVWSCPDCGGDLDDSWCADCCVSWSWPQLAGLDDAPDYMEVRDGV